MTHERCRSSPSRLESMLTKLETSLAFQLPPQVAALTHNRETVNKQPLLDPALFCCSILGDVCFVGSVNDNPLVRVSASLL